MNEIETNKFDYSVLDSETAVFLKDRENSMRQTLEKTAQSLGEDLYKAQQKLSSHYKGTFEKWYTALGFKKQSVYNYINRYEYVVQQLDNKNDIQKFQDLPVRLQNEVSKKSAHPEVNKAVFDGDIKTHKEYKELERRLKAERKERERLEAENEELANQEPERIEVVPDDYDYIKGNFESAINLRDRYKEQLEEMRKELNESSNDVHLDDSEYESLKLKEENLRSKINSYEKLYDMQSQLELILSKTQPKIHSLKTENITNEFGIVEELDSTLNEVIKVCMEIKKILPNKNIIEGEIVND